MIDNNSYDLALYQLAEQALEKKIRSLDGFEARLSDYRDRCHRLRRRKLVRFS